MVVVVFRWRVVKNLSYFGLNVYCGIILLCLSELCYKTDAKKSYEWVKVDRRCGSYGSSLITPSLFTLGTRLIHRGLDLWNSTYLLKSLYTTVFLRKLNSRVSYLLVVFIYFDFINSDIQVGEKIRYVHAKENTHVIASLKMAFMSN